MYQIVVCVFNDEMSTFIRCSHNYNSISFHESRMTSITTILCKIGNTSINTSTEVSDQANKGMEYKIVVLRIDNT